MEGSIQKIVIILPAFNEETGIKSVLNGIREVMQDSRRDYTVIAVNDGSTDNTSFIINSYKDKMPMRPLEHQTNRGIGMAFLTGLKEAIRLTRPNDIIILMESDNTSEIGILKDMIDKLNQDLDIVCASRYLKGGGYLRFPLKRLFLSKMANMLLKTVFPMGRIRDYTIFYRAYRASLINDAFKEYGDSFIKYPGFVANVEMLIKLRRFHPRVSEVPLRYDYGFKKGRSKMRMAKTVFDYLHLILTGS